MRKYCWLYRCKKNGKVYHVMRPHRRAIERVYYVKELGAAVIGHDFREWYEYVGREK